jgi:hypothetical protein
MSTGYYKVDPEIVKRPLAVFGVAVVRLQWGLSPFSCIFTSRHVHVDATTSDVGDVT